MKPFARNMVALIVVLLGASSGWAHGVECSVAPAEGYLVKTYYDDGEPMSYAEVKIQAPNSDLAFQTGRTDRNGRLMFYPDGPGRWQVEARDGMGHRATLALELADDASQSSMAAAAPSTARPGSRSQAMTTGLAIIFGLAGLCYGWRAKRQPLRTAGRCLESRKV